MKKFFIFLLILSPMAEAKTPKILSFQNGDEVRDLVDWNLRKAEIRELLQSEVYGYMPKLKISSIRSKADIELENLNGLYREVEIHFETLPENKFIRLGVFLPHSTKKVPVFLSVNHCGNYTLVDDERIEIDNKLLHHPVFCKNKGRGDLKDNYPIKKIFEAGYGFVTFDVSDIDADIATLKTDGIHGHVQTHDDPRKSWGTLISWAWGLTKAVDYIQTDQDIDHTKIIVQGHSRRGKAALLAGAFDERIAMVIAHQSGTGGTASFRGATFRERPSMIANGSFIYPYMSEPNQLTHWFSQYFRTWTNDLTDLPIDSHLTMALIAPRPLMDVQGTKDFWTGPNSAWKMMKKVNKLYTFLGVQGFKGKGRLGYSSTTKRNPSRRSVVRRIRVEHHEPISSEKAGRLLQYREKTGHVQNEFYWDIFIQFSDLF